MNASPWDRTIPPKTGTLICEQSKPSCTYSFNQDQYYRQNRKHYTPWIAIWNRFTPTGMDKKNISLLVWQVYMKKASFIITFIPHYECEVSKLVKKGYVILTGNVFYSMFEKICLLVIGTDFILHWYRYDMANINSSLEFGCKACFISHLFHYFVVSLETDFSYWVLVIW